jgi:hypothetical protein
MLLISIALALGCATPPILDETPPPAPTWIAIEPGDLTSGHEPFANLTLRVLGGRPEKVAAASDAATSSVRLERSDRTVVPIRFETVEGANDLVDGERRMKVLAETPLPEGWHSLRVEVPTGVTPSPGMHVFDDGAVGVRFRVGHELVVARVDFCTEQGNEILVTFSEPAHLAAGAAFADAVMISDAKGSPLGCTDGSAERGPENSRLIDGESLAVWEAKCGVLPELVEIRVTDAARDTNEKPARTLGGDVGFAASFDWKALPYSPGCHRWVTP